MTHSHYGLQALLYVVALHRYLRWRLPGYSAERNLAGVLYLFLRGMIGSDTPEVDGVPCGVFTWHPPAALVEALSDVFDRGERRMSDVVERFDARLARGASGLLLEFNDAGVLAAADVHVARRLAALTGGADDAVVLATALAVRAPRIGHVFVDLERISETATVDVDDPIDLTTLPWPSPSGLGRTGRGERARRPGSSTAPGGQRALPRPLLARGAAGRGRPRGARRRRRRRADGRARRRHHASVHGRDARRQAEAGGRRRGAPPPGGRGRRPGHRQDDDGRPHRRAAGGAGTRRGSRHLRSSRSPPRPARPPRGSPRRSTARPRA